MIFYKDSPLLWMSYYVMNPKISYVEFGGIIFSNYMFEMIDIIFCHILYAN